MKYSANPQKREEKILEKVAKAMEKGKNNKDIAKELRKKEKKK